MALDSGGLTGQPEILRALPLSLVQGVITA